MTEQEVLKKVAENATQDETKEEIKVETAVEEADANEKSNNDDSTEVIEKEASPVEENKSEEISSETEEPKELKDFEKAIEDRRLPLIKKYNSTRKISNFMTFGVLILCIAGMYLVTTPNLVWLGWILLGVGLAAMILFYFLSKKKFDAQTREYLDFVNVTLNKETFTDKSFSNLESTNNKVEVADVATNGAYKDIVRVASRNIINGKCSNTEFKFAELALFKKTDNKKQPTVTAFVGKYFEAKNSLNFDGNIVINISRSEPVDEPNALGEKTKLYSDGAISVYGDEGMDFRKIVGDQFFGNVKKIEPINHLLNLVISIWEGHTLVFMSYDDDVIAIPFDKPMNSGAFESFTTDLKKVFNVINLLGK